MIWTYLISTILIKTMIIEDFPCNSFGLLLNFQYVNSIYIKFNKFIVISLILNAILKRKWLFYISVRGDISMVNIFILLFLWQYHKFMIIYIYIILNQNIILFHVINMLLF